MFAHKYQTCLAKIIRYSIKNKHRYIAQYCKWYTITSSDKTRGDPIWNSSDYRTS